MHIYEIENQSSISLDERTNVWYNTLDTKHLFDGIDDKTVENNIKTAENTIKNNIDKGLLSKDYTVKLPNLDDGLALFYASADSGKSKAAKRAREAAYTEAKEPANENKGLFNFSQSVEGKEKSQPKVEDLLLMSGNDKTASKMPLAAEPKEDKRKVTLFKNTSTGFNKRPWSMELGTEKKLDNSLESRIIPAKDNISIQEQKESSEINRYTEKDLFNDIIEVLTPKAGIKDGLVDSFKNFGKLFSDKEKELFDYIVPVTDALRAQYSVPATAGKLLSKVVWKYAGCKGYLKINKLDFSADLLEHSLQEIPRDLQFYDDSYVADIIKKDNRFTDKVKELAASFEKTGKKCSDGFSFPKGDLFYSLNNCNIEVTDVKQKNGKKEISVHIFDTYDYTKIWTAMGDKGINLGTIANDAGTISSLLDAINPYQVDIYLTVRS